MSGGGAPRAIGGFPSRGFEVFSTATMISEEHRCGGRAAKKFTLDPSRVPDESEAFMLACVLWYSSTARGTTGPQDSTAPEVATGLMATDA